MPRQHVVGTYIAPILNHHDSAFASFFPCDKVGLLTEKSLCDGQHGWMQSAEVADDGSQAIEALNYVAPSCRRRIPDVSHFLFARRHFYNLHILQREAPTCRLLHRAP